MSRNVIDEAAQDIGGLLDPRQAQAVTKPDAAGNVAYATTLNGNSALSADQLQSATMG